MKELYAVYFNYKQTNLIIGLHESREGIEKYRLKLAKKIIKDFESYKKEYVKDWRFYHSIEYADYKVPNDEEFVDQFLSEECQLSIEEVDNDDIEFSNLKTVKDLCKLYDQEFYDKLRESRDHYRRQSLTYN